MAKKFQNSPTLKDSLPEFCFPSLIWQAQGCSHLCYRQLLLGNVSRDIDHFHPVPQGFWDCFCNVGSTNEKYLWEKENYHQDQQFWPSSKYFLVFTTRHKHSKAKQPARGEHLRASHHHTQSSSLLLGITATEEPQVEENIIPWINPLAHQGSDPRSWHSALGLAAQGVRRKDPLDSLSQFYPPVVHKQQLLKQPVSQAPASTQTRDLIKRLIRLQNSTLKGHSAPLM